MTVKKCILNITNNNYSTNDIILKDGVLISGTRLIIRAVLLAKLT